MTDRTRGEGYRLRTTCLLLAAVLGCSPTEKLLAVSGGASVSLVSAGSAEIYVATSTGAVLAAPRDGGDPRVLREADPGAPTDPVFESNLAFAAAGPDDVVIAVRMLGQVLRVPKDGGAISSILTVDVQDLTMAVDAERAYLTWAGLFNGRILAVPLGGGAPEMLASANGDKLAVDDTHLYFTDMPSASGPLLVRRLPKSAGPDDMPELVTSVPQGHSSNDVLLALSDTHVVVSIGGDLWRAPKEGGTPVSNPAAHPATCLLADGDDVYSCEVGPSAVIETAILNRLAPFDAAPEAIDTGDGPLTGVAVDGHDVYWGMGPAVYRRAKNATSP